MGDVLGALFGGGERQTQTTTPDPIAQELNRLRLGQLSSLFSVAPVSQYGSPRPDIYSPSSNVTDLFNEATSTNADLFSYDDYLDLGLDETRNYISRVATPEILSSAALAGLESGGVVPESIARATAQIGLPFVQGLPQASLAPFQQNLARSQRAQTLFPIADYGRSLREQDFLRQQGVVQTGLTGLPFTPGTSATGRTGSQPLFNFFGQG
jgi:hypothetical protein